MAQATLFTAEGAGTTVSGVVDYADTGETIIRFYHPRTGRLVEDPLQGWADEPGQHAHERLAELLALIADDDAFCDTLYGYVEATVKHNPKAGVFRCWEAH